MYRHPTLLGRKACLPTKAATRLAFAPWYGPTPLGVMAGRYHGANVKGGGSSSLNKLAVHWRWYEAASSDVGIIIKGNDAAFCVSEATHISTPCYGKTHYCHLLSVVSDKHKRAKSRFIAKSDIGYAFQISLDRVGFLFLVRLLRQHCQLKPWDHQV